MNEDERGELVRIRDIASRCLEPKSAQLGTAKQQQVAKSSHTTRPVPHNESTAANVRPKAELRDLVDSETIDMETLICIRKAWDRYLVGMPNTPGASSIPPVRGGVFMFLAEWVGSRIMRLCVFMSALTFRLLLFAALHSATSDAIHAMGCFLELVLNIRRTAQEKRVFITNVRSTLRIPERESSFSCLCASLTRSDSTLRSRIDSLRRNPRLEGRATRISSWRSGLHRRVVLVRTWESTILVHIRVCLSTRFADVCRHYRQRLSL